MQEESELHWRKQETIFNRLGGQQRDEYIQSTRRAHIMESQTLIRYIVQMNLFFVVLLIYDIYHYTTRNYFLRCYGLIPVLGFAIIPPILFWAGRPVFNATELSADEQHILTSSLAPSLASGLTTTTTSDDINTDDLILSNTSFHPLENVDLPPRTLKTINRFMSIISIASVLTTVLALYIVAIFLYIILWSKQLQILADPTTGLPRFISITTLDALTRWELTLVPILSMLSTISLFHGVTTVAHLKGLVGNGLVAYPVHGVFSDPDY